MNITHSLPKHVDIYQYYLHYLVIWFTFTFIIGMISSKTYTKDEILDISNQYAIVVYDGQCMMCNRFIQFLLKNDTKEQFKFVAYQAILNHEIYGNRESIELIYKKNQTTQSTAILNCFKQLSFMYCWISIFSIVPRSLRDKIYSIVAKNRYSLFGKSEKCIIPNEDSKNRFL